MYEDQVDLGIVFQRNGEGYASSKICMIGIHHRWPFQIRVCRKVGTNFLTLKSKALAAIFKTFKSLVEKSGNDICCPPIDQGEEFTSLQFYEYRILNDISR